MISAVKKEIFFFYFAQLYIQKWPLEFCVLKFRKVWNLFFLFLLFIFCLFIILFLNEFITSIIAQWSLQSNFIGFPSPNPNTSPPPTSQKVWNLNLNFEIFSDLEIAFWFYIEGFRSTVVWVWQSSVLLWILYFLLLGLSQLYSFFFRA